MAAVSAGNVQNEDLEPQRILIYMCTYIYIYICRCHAIISCCVDQASLNCIHSSCMLDTWMVSPRDVQQSISYCVSVVVRSIHMTTLKSQMGWFVIPPSPPSRYPIPHPPPLTTSVQCWLLGPERAELWNTSHGLWNPACGTWLVELSLWNLACGTWFVEPGSWNPSSWNPLPVEHHYL